MYYYGKLSGQYTRMRGPAFTEKDAQEVLRMPVQAPFADLDVYGKVLEQVAGYPEWQALTRAHEIADLQQALGQPSVLPATVGDLLAPSFDSRGQLARLRDEFRVRAFSVRPVLDDAPALQYPGELFLPLRVSYSGALPIWGVTLQVRFPWGSETRSCVPARQDARGSPNEHAFDPGQTLELACASWDKVSETPAEVAALLRKLAAEGLPSNVSVLQRYEFRPHEKLGPYASSLQARTWRVSVGFDCGMNPVCQGNRLLLKLNLLRFTANPALLAALVGCFLGCLLVTVISVAFGNRIWTAVLGGVWLAIAAPLLYVAVVYVAVGAAYHDYTPIVLLMLFAGGCAVGVAWTRAILR